MISSQPLQHPRSYAVVGRLYAFSFFLSIVSFDNVTYFCYNNYMDFFAGIYGNDGIKALLRSGAENGTLSHAYILEGAEGSGRRSLVRATLCTMVDDGNMQDKILRDICPDVRYIGVPEGKAQIPVDHIREIRKEAYLSANDLDFKVFVITEAHRMNEAAQNALLKLLEEPPKGVYFFLLCESGSRLLPTVLSRAILLRTEVFSEEALDAYLCEQSPKAALMKRQKGEEFAFLLKSSGGSIGKALSILNGESKLSSSIYDSVIGLMNILRNPDKAALILYEGKIPDTREGYSDFLTLLATAMRDILAYKYGAPSLLFFGSTEEVEEYAFDFSADYLARKIELCLKHIEQNEYSINLRVARLRLLEELWR